MRTSRAAVQRRGFVLLTTIIVIAGASGLGLLIARQTQGLLLAATNRNSYVVARWLALECISRLRATLDDRGGVETELPPWLRVDVLSRESAQFQHARGCTLEARALGDQININTADANLLRRLMTGAGMAFPAADSLTQALMDWRDTDDIPLPLGAEAGWYAGEGRLTPRNGPLQSDRELHLIRGFDRAPEVVHLLGTTPGRASLAHAPKEVLLTLPGFTAELANLIVARRAQGTTLPSSVLHLTGSMSASSRDSLLMKQGELSALLTIEPDGWVLRSRGQAPGSRVTSVLELVITRVGSSTQVISHREWWE